MGHISRKDMCIMYVLLADSVAVIGNKQQHLQIFGLKVNMLNKYEYLYLIKARHNFKCVKMVMISFTASRVNIFTAYDLFINILNHFYQI